MLLCITFNQFCGQLIILHLLICLFYPLYCNIISLTSKITQEFHLLLALAKNEGFKDPRITESSDNRDSDNRGPAVPSYPGCPSFQKTVIYICIKKH